MDVLEKFSKGVKVVMLNIINEDLMSYDVVEVHEPKSNKSYFKLRMLTSNRLLQPKSKLQGHTPGKEERPKENQSKFRVESQNDPLVPVNREVMRISAPLKRIKDIMGEDPKNASFPMTWTEFPMSINVTNSSRFNTQIDVRCHEQGEDRANLFVIAFPFNGMIKPLEENPQYRIYKGFIASSAKPFFYDNHKYRKILYLVLEVNKNLFQEDHKYHTNEVKITLESYALFDDRETGRKKTNHEQMDVHIFADSVVQVWSYNVIDDSVFMNVEPGKQLWPTYTFGRDDRNRSSNDHSEKTNGQSTSKRNHHRNNQPKGYSVEGNMLVTVNKHGIRKEIPMNTDRHQNKGRPYQNRRMDDPDNLDDMIARSGMYDNKSKRGKKNGGRSKQYRR